MKTADQYNKKQNLSVLLVGEPKTGKTRVLASFPGLYICDCDRNLASAVRAMGDKKFFFDDPYVDEKGAEADPWMRWTIAVNGIKQAAKSPEVQTIAIDGLAALADMLVAHIIHQAKLSEGKVLDRMRIQDYQPLKTLLTSLIMGLRSTGKIIVVTSHQKAEKDELTGRMRYTLNMPGALSENFGGFFSDTWATTSRPNGAVTAYELHTRPTGFHVNLGTSLTFDTKPFDLTNKSPDQIWALIAKGM